MAALTAWGADPEADHQRRMQRAILASLGGHVVLVGILLVGPGSSPMPVSMPPAITVRLMAALPAPPQAAKPAPAPVARPKPKLKILPKQAPPATARPRKKAEPEVVRRKPRPKEMAPEDAMAFLRQTAGEDAEPLLKAPATAAPAVTSSMATSEGTRAATEADKFAIEVRRAIRPNWKVPDDFRRERGTLLEIDIGPDGRLLGPPRVLRSSGNPYYDDNTIRALERTPRLPVPPKPGPIQIFLTPEEPG
jgi:outer membrane biosynthesis protein TonB